MARQQYRLFVARIQQNLATKSKTPMFYREKERHVVSSKWLICKAIRHAHYTKMQKCNHNNVKAMLTCDLVVFVAILTKRF